MCNLFMYLKPAIQDPKIVLQEGPNAILWAFDEWKKKLEAGSDEEEEVELNAASDVPTSGVVDKLQVAATIGSLSIVVVVVVVVATTM